MSPRPDQHPDALALAIGAIANAVGASVERVKRGVVSRLCGICGCLCLPDEACPVCRADLVPA